MRNLVIRFFLPFALSLLLYSCATVSAPTGGPKDATGPRFTGSSIPNAYTNFNEKAIILEFDEYVALKNPTQNIISSPPLGSNVAFTARKNKVFITFKEELEKDVTYQLNFGNSITDVNENNPLNNFQFVFATGDHIDSLSVKGKITPINGVKLENNTLIGFYKDTRDSVFYTQPPFYFTFVKEDGFFTMNYMKEGAYKVVALKDANNNYYYDLPNEAIGFSDSIFQLNETTSGLNISLFLPEEKSIRVKSFSGSIKDYTAQFEFSSALSSGATIEVVTLADSLQKEAIWKLSDDRLKLTTWIQPEFSNRKAIQTVLTLDGALVDTFNHSMSNPKIPELKLSLESLKLSPNDSIIINASSPLTREVVKLSIIDTLKQDTQRIEISPSSDFQYVIPKGLLTLSENVYTLLIADTTISNIYDKKNALLKQKFTLMSSEDFGTLLLDFENALDSTQYLLRLLTKEKKPLRKLTLVPGRKKWVIPSLPPATYTLEIIIDENANGVWNSGTYLPRRYPETIYLYPKEFVIRANWELEELINLELR